jgi:hypothetical protein
MMSVRSTGAGIALIALVLVVVAPAGSAPATAPKIVAAAMVDADGDFRTDRLRVTYSGVVRHQRDTDGRYPFALTGYKIASVTRASGRSVTLLLVERKTADPLAKPALRYTRTTSKPVTDSKGRQAVRQTFKGTRPHNHRPHTTPPPPPPPPAPDTDPDKDGYAAPGDCKPDDPTIHPGATDKPDLAFIDTNCDGIDGDEKTSIFVSPTGNDANPGTKSQPKRQIQAAALARGERGEILVAAGDYDHVRLVYGTPGLGKAALGIYGAYTADWERTTSSVTKLSGPSYGLTIDNLPLVILQYLTVSSTSNGAEQNSYGIHVLNTTPAIDGVTVALQRVEVQAGPGSAGATGAPGATGRNGADGYPGKPGHCDSGPPGEGGIGGPSPIGRPGGNGGRGGAEGSNDGLRGDDGPLGGEGGVGGKAGGTRHGESGAGGLPGNGGAQGAGGSGFGASTVWQSTQATAGSAGTSGSGGGGGGGGSGQGGAFVDDGAGNGGGGGGAGGEGGAGGRPGGAGGVSIGIYIFKARVTIDGGHISTGAGGNGGTGGAGGVAGKGGAAGLESTTCSNEIGKGGEGGDGSDGGGGGGGGGGAGGPSIGVVEVGSEVTIKSTPITVQPGGQGGAEGAGAGGTPSPVASAAGLSREVLAVPAP